MYPYDDNFDNQYTPGESSLDHSEKAPEVIPPPAPRRPKTHKKSTIALILCACILASAATGATSGYLVATSMKQPENLPVVTIPTTQTNAAPSSTAGVMTVSQVVGQVSDSIVEINTDMQTTMFAQTVTAQAAGSGVILSPDGYIVTNNHVIENATKITVKLSNGDSYDATLVGTDPQTDVAVIKIDANNLHAATMGSSSSLHVGDTTIAIGNPLGELGGTVTNGIVSALDRNVNLGGESMTLLQTNAAISPGNSGGGLFNDKGELIGIVVAKSEATGSEGLGFAIPIDTVKGVVNDLIAKGYVSGRGELGVSVINIADERSAFVYRVPQLGVYIAAIEPGSAAEQAKLKVGDGILAVDGTEVSDADGLKNELKKHSAGDQVKLTILRDGSKQDVTVTLQESIPESVKKQSKDL